MSLLIDYSKEVAKELTKIAVVLPGAPVEIGQIIHFPYGKRGVWPFRKTAPRGSFSIITNLNNLGVTVQDTGPDPDGDPYIFSSRRGVEVDFNSGARGNAGSGLTGSGEIKADFKREGAVYFAAIDCKTVSISNLDQVGVDLTKHNKDIIWNETFLVTSVTIASKALIMQSSTNSASLSIEGDVKGLITGSSADISANSKISVKNFKQSSIFKPWSDNVTVFIGLHRFGKVAFGYKPSVEVSRSLPFETDELDFVAGELVNSNNDEYALNPVSALEILDDSDIEERLT